MVMMVVSDGGRRLGVVASSPDLVPNATAALYVRGAWTTPTNGKMGAAVACACTIRRTASSTFPCRGAALRELCIRRLHCCLAL